MAAPMTVTGTVTSQSVDASGSLSFSITDGAVPPVTHFYEFNLSAEVKALWLSSLNAAQSQAPAPPGGTVTVGGPTGGTAGAPSTPTSVGRP